MENKEEPLLNNKVQREPSSTEDGLFPQTQFISILVNQVQKGFKKNVIRTSKYTLLSFLPKNLFLQFTKLANIYFLMICFLQVIPAISISNGQPANLIPLVVVIFVSGVKDLLEDRKRHKSDNQENNRLVRILQPSGNFEQKRWRDLKVGQIVKVFKDNFFPADLILLTSS